MTVAALLETDLAGLPRRRGKVRDVYDLGDNRLLVVATDRISAFDWVLPTGIPDKGRVLTAISAWWFGRVDVAHHLVTTAVDDAALGLRAEERAALTGRTMIVRKARVVPFECVVRGYLAGSGWAEYRESGTVCGEPLPTGLVESAPIGRPIFTPATKAAEGHDVNISYGELARSVGDDLAADLRARSLTVYEAARVEAAGRGLILADTKFEWGFDELSGELLLIDEILTPDSSRYWPAAEYRSGGPQPSFDKQYVRDWLAGSGWDRQGPPPPLPAEVVERTRAKYVECYERLTGRPFAALDGPEPPCSAT